jgi:hypothetical protein
MTLSNATRANRSLLRELWLKNEPDPINGNAECLRQYSALVLLLLKRRYGLPPLEQEMDGVYETSTNDKMVREWTVRFRGVQITLTPPNAPAEIGCTTLHWQHQQLVKMTLDAFDRLGLIAV